MNKSIVFAHGAWLTSKPPGRCSMRTDAWPDPPAEGQALGAAPNLVRFAFVPALTTLWPAALSVRRRLTNLPAY